MHFILHWSRKWSKKAECISVVVIDDRERERRARFRQNILPLCLFYCRLVRQQQHWTGPGTAFTTCLYTDYRERERGQGCCSAVAAVAMRRSKFLHSPPKKGFKNPADASCLARGNYREDQEPMIVIDGQINPSFICTRKYCQIRPIDDIPRQKQLPMGNLILSLQLWFCSSFILHIIKL